MNGFDKLEIIGLVAIGTIDGQGVYNIGDYVYKKRKRAKLRAENRRGPRAIDSLKDYTIEALIDEYGDLC